MMENSPDPGETEEEEEEESGISSPKTNPSLLEEIRMLSQANNNNCSYEGHTSSLISPWLCTIKKPSRVLNQMSQVQFVFTVCR